MSHIAIRTSDAEGWMFVQKTDYSDEDYFVDLILKEPSLIPRAEIGLSAGASVVALGEVALPWDRWADVVLIDSLGEIVIVECKLESNSEHIRTYIGQVLDYASSLATLSYEKLDALVVRKYQIHLHELMEKRVPAEDWDENRFRRGVANTLRSGRFKLVIAIGEIDPHLARILRYVSSQGTSEGSLRIFGLELKYHKQDNIEAIIPHIVNPLGAVAAESTEERRDWGEDSFRAELAKIKEDGVRVAARDMLDFVLNQSDGFEWGRGKRGSIFFKSSIEGQLVAVFYYRTDGVLSIDLNYLHPKVSIESFETFVESLANIRGFETVREKTNWQEFETPDTIMDESARAEFKDAVLAFQSSLRT